MEEVHTNSGGYDLEGVVWHQHSNLLLVEIMKHFPKGVPVIDLGCGHNFYVNILNYAGYASACGFDNVDLGSSNFLKQDLTKDLGKKVYSNVISLEVGEHIPLHLSDKYIDNLCSYDGDVIMSWAVPGQAGVGHINCQPQEWVEMEMLKRNYVLNSERTQSLRSAVESCHCTWFKNTLMYFEICE